jgi:hypothetical protein
MTGLLWLCYNFCGNGRRNPDDLFPYWIWVTRQDCTLWTRIHTNLTALTKFLIDEGMIVLQDQRAIWTNADAFATTVANIYFYKDH